MKRVLLILLYLIFYKSLMAQYNITMMSYNIKGHEMSSSKLNEVAKVINQYQPDVVSLQEIDLRPFMLYHDYIKQLAEATGMYYEFLPTVSNDYGIGLLSRVEPLSVQTKIIERSANSTDRENRGIIIAEFDDYYFLSTHYSLNADDRDSATEYILNFTDQADKTVFVAGDFNAQPTYRAMVTFKNYGYSILTNTSINTIPSDNPTKCIDMVLGYKKSLNYRILRSAIAETPEVDLQGISDHLPVYLIMRTINDGATGIDEDVKDQIRLQSEGGNIRVQGINDPSQIEIYDLMGTLVHNQQIYEDGLIELFSGLKPGMYLIKVKNDVHSYCLKYYFN